MDLLTLNLCPEHARSFRLSNVGSDVWHGRHNCEDDYKWNNSSLHPLYSSKMTPPPHFLAFSDTDTAWFLSPINLDEDDWNIVIMECSSLSAKWERLSGYLGLPISLIDSIKENSPSDVDYCWSESLKHWIRQNYKTKIFGLPSWRTLLKAVARVDKHLFKKLADTHQGITISLIMTLHMSHPLCLGTSAWLCEEEQREGTELT